MRKACPCSSIKRCPDPTGNENHSDEPEKAYTNYKSHLAGDGLNDSFDPYNHKTVKVFLKCNPTGGAGNGLDRDIVNEHKDRKAKDVSKGLHSQLTDAIVTKAALGDNGISLIETQACSRNF